MLEKITTERLILRQFDLEDAEAIFKYRTKEEVKRFQSWGSGSIDDLRSDIVKMYQKDRDGTGWYQIGITLRDSDILIGDCGFNSLEDDPRIAEIGIAIDPNFQRKGYASESLKAVLGFLFENQKKHRVFALVDANNTASAKLMNHLGMRKEGHFVKSRWFRESWVDDIIFAMLASEWFSQTVCD